MSPEAVETEIRSSNLIVIASAIPDHVVATNFVLNALKRTNCPNLIVEVVDDLDGQNLIHNAVQVGNFMLLDELKSIYPKQFQEACEQQDNVSNLSGFLSIYLPAFRPELNLILLIESNNRRFNFFLRIFNRRSDRLFLLRFVVYSQCVDELCE